jgi:hypothetical protein
MKRTVAFLSLAGISLLALAACADNVPTPGFTQGRAIDQDIEATHVVGPTVTSPAFTAHDPTPTLVPWRNEENIDTKNQAEQTGQIPQ